MTLDDGTLSYSVDQITDVDLEVYGSWWIDLNLKTQYLNSTYYAFPYFLS